MRCSVPRFLAHICACVLLLIVEATNPPSVNAGTTAARELGQPDFLHSSANEVDTEAMSINANDAGVAVDTSVSPNRVYVTDSNNNRVLGYASVAALVNGASADIVIGQPDFFSNVANNGSGLNPASNASLSTPRGVAVDGAGNVYVADRNNCRVLVFPNPFTIKANTGQTAGFTAAVVLGQVGDFTSDTCGGSTTASADNLDDPEDVALDKAGNLYVADAGDNRVLEFDGPITSGTFSANRVFGQLGSFADKGANSGGISKDSLQTPTGVALDPNSNLYVADSGNNRVLEYNTPLSLTKITGSGDTSADVVWGQGGNFATSSANSGGVSATSLNVPRKIALDGSANLYVGDFSNNRVLEYNEGTNPPTNLTANNAFGQSSLSAAACNQSAALPTVSTLCNPSGVAADSGNDLVIVDGNNNRALKYVTPLTASKVTGSGDTTADIVLGQPDFTRAAGNFIDGGVLNTQRQIAIDASATPNRLFVADTVNNRVLGWRNATGFANGAPADLVLGQSDFYSNVLNLNGSSSPTASTLWNPEGVAVDGSGNLFVADSLNNRVIEYTTPFTACGGNFPCVGAGAAMVFGQPTLTTSGLNCTSPPSASTVCQPAQLAVDSEGNLYVADYGNNRVLEYNTPLISTSVSGSGDTTADLVFGQGGAFTTSDCNHPSSAVSANSLCGPTGIATDPRNDNLYVSDSTNGRVLEYNESASATQGPANVDANAVFGQLGSLTTKGCLTVNGAPNGETICSPEGLALDATGGLYIADEGENRLLELGTPLSSSSTANVVWGQGGSLIADKCNLAAPAPSAATLCSPYGVAIDTNGGVYISDTVNSRVTAYNTPFPPPGATVVEPSDGVLILKPERVHFGILAVGKRRHRNVELVNAGPVPVRILSISVNGDFTLTSSCDNTLEPGATCALDVIFNPITGGDRGGTIIVSDNANGDPHVFELFGHGRRRGAR